MRCVDPYGARCGCNKLGENIVIRIICTIFAIILSLGVFSPKFAKSQIEGVIGVAAGIIAGNKLGDITNQITATIDGAVINGDFLLEKNL